jgi:hypothetical protein
MIRRNRRSLPWFGAVAAALLLALPALADEIEPEPTLKEKAVEPELESGAEAEGREKGESEVAEQPDRNFDQLVDLVILRPAGLASIVVGGVFFVPAALMASPSGMRGVRDAWNHFVAPSVERTFNRPLGEL